MGLRIALTSVHSWPAVHRGAERYVHELSQALQAAGHDVRVLSTGEPARSRVLDVPVRRFRSRSEDRRSREAVFGGQSLTALAASRIDVWHATSLGDAVAAVSLQRLRRGLRTVFTDHGFPVRASRERLGDGKRHQTVVDRIGSYVCVSETAGSWLARDFGRRADVVPPGVDTSHFTPGGARAAVPTVLYSGTMEDERKGIRLLVEATALVPGARLVLAGQGTPPLDGLSTEHVTVAGAVSREDLRDLYRAAWVTALPSTAEAFGMALTESLACGTPGVGRQDAGGPPEILTEGCGALCEGTAESLAQALQTAMTSPDPSACRARAEDFDWRRRVVPDLERIYAV